MEAILFSVRGMVAYLLKYLIRDLYIAEKAATKI